MVLDPYDPSGMFSKAGRASLEMYQMILQRDRILYNKKPVYNPSKILGNNGPIFGNPLDSKAQKSESKTESHPQPFAKMMSRELLGKLDKNDRRFGMYNPKYNLIYKKSPLYEDEKDQEKKKAENEKKSKSPTRKKKAISMHLPPPSPDTSFTMEPPKIKGPTPLKLQLGRDRVLNYSQDVNEKRFELISLPEIYSGTHKVPAVKIGNILGRSKANFHRDDCAKGLEYKPNYHLVWPKSSIKIPNFGKSLARKGLENTSMVQNSALSHEDSSFISNSARKILKTPDFSKMMAREKTLDDTSRISATKKHI